jgi:hypothetical protein
MQTTKLKPRLKQKSEKSQNLQITPNNNTTPPNNRNANLNDNPLSIRYAKTKNVPAYL